MKRHNVNVEFSDVVKNLKFKSKCWVVLDINSLSNEDYLNLRKNLEENYTCCDIKLESYTLKKFLDIKLNKRPDILISTFSDGTRSFFVKPKIYLSNDFLTFLFELKLLDGIDYQYFYPFNINKKKTQK